MLYGFLLHILAYDHALDRNAIFAYATVRDVATNPKLPVDPKAVTRMLTRRYRVVNLVALRHQRGVMQR